VNRHVAAGLVTGIVGLFASCREGVSVDASVEGSDAALRELLGFAPAQAGWELEVDSVGLALAREAGSVASEETKIQVISRWMASPEGVRPRLSPDDTDLVPSLAWRRRRGGCTSLAWIWMRIARAMDLELEPVLLPGHVVLRTSKGRLLETLQGGLERSGAFYDSAFSLSHRPAYRLDATSGQALEASLLVHRGLLSWKRQDLAGAEALLRAAAALVPGLPEAQGNLGLVLLARGDASQAREHLGIALAGDSLNAKARERLDDMR